MSKICTSQKDNDRLAQGAGPKDEFCMTAENWERLDSMTDADIHARASTDPDNPPTPPEKLARMRRISPAKFIRQKLAMTQEAFAAAYGIPLDVLKAWERHDTEPGLVEISYLRAIERAPQATRVPEPA